MPNGKVCPWFVVFAVILFKTIECESQSKFQNTRIPCYKQVSALLVWRILIGAALSAARQCVMWHWERRRRSRKKTLLVSRVLVKGWESVGQSGIPFGCQSVIQGLCFSVSLMTLRKAGVSLGIPFFAAIYCQLAIVESDTKSSSNYKKGLKDLMN